MRRRTKIVILALLLVVVAAAVLLPLSWLLGTGEGARWFVAQLSRYSGGAVTVERIEGRLLDQVNLRGVRLDEKGLEAKVDKLELRWRPLALLSGRLSIRELAAGGVRIREKGPREKKPLDLTWPRVPGFMRLLGIRVRHLVVKGVTYIPLEGRQWEITSLSGGARWGYGILSLRDFSISTPYGKISGKAAAGLDRPFISADILGELSNGAEGMERFSLTARLFPGKGDEQVAGKVAVSGKGAQRGPVELSAVTALTRSSIKLGDIVLSENGRRGRLTGNGEVEFGHDVPQMRLSLKLDSLDLGKETAIVTDLSGVINAKGSPGKYSGSFSLANRGKGWRDASLSGNFSGNGKGIRITPVQGSLVGGKVKGDISLEWNEGLLAMGTLSGDGLDPARIAPQWKGGVNFDLAGSVTRRKGAPIQWQVNARLRESTLHGRTLSGEAVAAYDGTLLDIDRLYLKGKGFDIVARGKPGERLALKARVDELALLVPGLGGELRGDGCMRWRNKKPSGELSLRGKGLSVEGARISAMELALQLNEGEGYPARVRGNLRGLGWRRFEAETVSLSAEGTLFRHSFTVSLRYDRGEMALSAVGGYGSGLWQGDLLKLSGRDRFGPWALGSPTRVAIGKSALRVEGLDIRGSEGERLSLSADIKGGPLQGKARGEWNGLNLGRLSPLLKGWEFAARSSGSLNLYIRDDKRLDARGKATASGSITVRGKRVAVDSLLLDLAGGGDGSRVVGEIHLGGGAGTIRGTFSSSQPLAAAIPETGKLSLNLNGMDTALLGNLLPKGMILDGTLSGSADGDLLPQRRVALSGSMQINGGKLHLRDDEGEIGIGIRSASAHWNWRDDSLSGNAEILLAEHGEARGTFTLPLPARIPPSLNREGRIAATLKARVGEKGILTALFPGIVRESSGNCTAELVVGGSWSAPELGGSLHLEKAGGYLPSAGIRLTDVEVDARLEKELISIGSFRGRSGQGSISGSGELHLKGREVDSFRGRVKGERFETIHFPEIRLQSSPDLTFDGTPKRFSVNGVVRIPEMEINGPPSGKVIEPSPDVVLEGSVPKAAKTPGMELVAQVKVVLGDKVRIKAEGLDALLAGSVDLTMNNFDKIYSRGEIRVVEGSYRTYGVNLNIDRGRLFYAGGPINRPTLDVLALRTVDDIKAGVTVGGTIQSPVVKLFSDPAMSDADVLAYIVLGRPLESSNGSQSGLLVQAAGALLSSGQARDIQEQIRSRLGLSTLEIGRGKEITSSGTMGYKVIPSAPPGTAAAAPAASETILTVGKYLTPKLYFSYGRSIFTGDNLFRLRYDIFKHLQIETQSGTESGADIYYSIEFD